MALIFQLEDGDENLSSDFSDSTENNIVLNGGNVHLGVGNPVRHATIPTVGTSYIGSWLPQGKTAVSFGGGNQNTNSLTDQKSSSFLVAETVAENNARAGTQSGTSSTIYTRSGVDFTVTKVFYKHGGDLSAAVANPRIVSELGQGWEIADWNDFSSFTENDFLGMLRILAPLAPYSRTCQQLLVEVDGSLEWNLGWILANGNGNRGSSYSWFWTFANRKKAPWYARQGSYLNDFVIYGGWNPTYPYLCKRTGSSLPDTKGGCF